MDEIEEVDWSDYPSHLESPSSPPFHGFDADDIPTSRIIIKTEVVDGEEVFDSIDRVKVRKFGRPRGSKVLDDSLIVLEKRRPVDKVPDPLTSKPKETPVIPKVRLGGTESRPVLYLVGQTLEKFRNAKLPTKGSVLARFLALLVTNSVKDAAAITRLELKAVWQHHFGSRLVQGKELGIEEAGDEKRKIVKQDRFIEDMIKAVWKDWCRLEVDSRRPSRSSKGSFRTKEENFTAELGKAFNITKVAAEDIIRHSGILDWRNEVQHLQNQLSDPQVGCLGSLDKVQQKCDTRKIVAVVRAEQSEKKKEAIEKELFERKGTVKEAGEVFVEDDNNNDKDFVDTARNKKKKKIDIMGHISTTADRTNTYYTARSMIAASAANALGVDVADTNISKTTAWRKAKEARTVTAATIKEAFKCPDKVTVHWDGKALTLRENQKSNRVCVYVSGAGSDCSRKLLAVPETPSGTGKAEATLVTDILASWCISKEVIGMVYDTTSSNTGADKGACKFIEEWCGRPVLWLACRHHIAELHISKVVHTVTGNTKDPGVEMFRRLKKEWSDLEIDLDNLVLFDISKLDPDLQTVARSVLSWATEQQGRKTWPREDYRELLELVIVSLGGCVPGFSFKIPGADHHARWMSKQIYNLKIRLLSNIFELSPQEQDEVDKIVEFVLLFYAKYWLQTPLPSSAARLDLEFMANMIKYRLTRPRISFAVLQSCYRHMWYITPQLIPLALADENLEDSIKEQVAMTLFNTERKEIMSGKPPFPVLPFGAEYTRQDMSSLISSDSWLIFQLLDLQGPQDWLQMPANLWNLFENFQVLQKFATNISVCNDIAERGIHLMSSFISHCNSEDQRQALFQCVEFHRNLVSDCTKKSLKLC